MRILVGILGGLLILAMLSEFFVAFLLPRRVKRDIRIARGIIRWGWFGWKWVARKLSPAAQDTMLGFWGPLALLTELLLWTIGLIFGFALLQWATGSHLAPNRSVDFGDDLFFSGGGFLSASTPLAPSSTLARFLFLAEAACGFAVLFIAIGYLPALFQAFSRREIAVSQLDPRAGSPPSAGALIERAGARGGWPTINTYLGEWENWSAELMETHLSYPLLAFFRSQHLNQNWLAAITTVLDTCSFTIASAPNPKAAKGAELTFAISRHAVVDLAFMFKTKPEFTEKPRLTKSHFNELYSLARRANLELRDEEEVHQRLYELLQMYEPYVLALARGLDLKLPGWIPPEGAESNWRKSTWQSRRRGFLP